MRIATLGSNLSFDFTFLTEYPYTHRNPTFSNHKFYQKTAAKPSEREVHTIPKTYHRNNNNCDIVQFSTSPRNHVPYNEPLTLNPMSCSTHLHRQVGKGHHNFIIPPYSILNPLPFVRVKQRRRHCANRRDWGGKGALLRTVGHRKWIVFHGIICIKWVYEVLE